MAETSDTTPETARPAAGDSGAQAPVRRRGLTLWLPVAGALVLLLALAAFLGWAWWSYRQTETGPTSGPDYLARWRSAVALNPEDLRARIELAYALRVIGRHEAAVKQLNMVLGHEPRSATAMLACSHTGPRRVVDRLRRRPERHRQRYATGA